MTSENVDRIVGGNFAPTSIPWQVSLLTMYTGHDDDKVIVCGGTILDSKTILTAAHCVDKLFGYELKSTEIQAGSTFPYKPYDGLEQTGQVQFDYLMFLNFKGY